MKYKQNKKSDSPSSHSDHIMAENIRNRKKRIESNGVEGGDSTDHDKMNEKHKRIYRIVSILTQFSLLLGLLVFLVLWLL